MNQDRVTIIRKFNASPERVFDAWLDPERARQFLFTESNEGKQSVIRAEIDARVGGSFLFVARRDGRDIDHIGEYLEIDRPRRLIFTLVVPAVWKEKSRVSVDIVPLENGCELTLTHEGLPSHLQTPVFQGWTVFLQNLQATQFDRRIGTREQWIVERLELLKAEKELTRLSDELARRRQQLPWVPVSKEYIFDTAEGEKTLKDMFGGHSQLLVYHFMFGPNWTEGCPGCSLHADSFDRAIVHLNHRDVTMLCASRAPLDRLESYKRRMGWSFEWVSSGRNDFNYDFGVSLNENQNPQLVTYNFTKPWSRSERGPAIAEEHAGLSAFVLENGVVYHTYSCYTRGLEAFNSTYQLLDRAPRGRDEAAFAVPHAWLRRRDQYES